MEEKLFEALKNNDAKLVKGLIKSGAHLGMKNGRTILDFPKIMGDSKIKNVIVNAVFDRIQNTKYQDEEIEAIEFKVIKSIANNDPKLKNSVKLRKTIDLFDQSLAKRIRNKFLQNTDREIDKISKTIDPKNRIDNHNSSSKPLNLADILNQKDFATLVKITRILAERKSTTPSQKSTRHEKTAVLSHLR